MRTVIEGKKVILVGDSTTTGGKGNLSGLIKPFQHYWYSNHYEE
ncbi:hypothetical protein [Yersinia similis]|uniref:Uncharacterized protein n=1 Tax=Yersinia similis TaxID=367190 RepID=A0A0T9QAX5_9GAMM|nr:hypothetical protein [Yersinia similis]CFQ72897.1 Uncharacterised protein [Yersinia similis]CNB85593.1 Uncharacterised protein [Yersinia similis]CNF70763.1 Uncharacterised protein [Yersinia similis]CNG60325.1 Uncharacterised protein [Yersinia similis]CNI03676.1 Uncharacterised protein [Yersinia similis]